MGPKFFAKHGVQPSHSCRRELGQFTAFDLVVLLTLSNILQNAMIGNDSSLLG